jgi:nucleotide-binding universal stress UspA family protein
MTDPILVAVDGREASTRAICFGLTQAHDLNTGLHIVYVTSGDDDEVTDLVSESVETAIENHEYGDDVVIQFTELDNPHKLGRPGVSIAHRLEEYMHDAHTNFEYLIIGNQHHDSVQKAMVGSVASTLVDNRTLPVLLVP